MYLVPNGRVPTGKGLKFNLACKGCNPCQKDKNQQHHAQTEICNVHVGGSLYPSMLSILACSPSCQAPILRIFHTGHRVISRTMPTLISFCQRWSKFNGSFPFSPPLTSKENKNKNRKCCIFYKHTHFNQL